MWYIYVPWVILKHPTRVVPKNISLELKKCSRQNIWLLTQAPKDLHKSMAKGTHVPSVTPKHPGKGSQKTLNRNCRKPKWPPKQLAIDSKLPKGLHKSMQFGTYVHWWSHYWWNILQGEPTFLSFFHLNGHLNSWQFSTRFNAMGPSTCLWVFPVSTLPARECIPFLHDSSMMHPSGLCLWISKFIIIVTR